MMGIDTCMVTYFAPDVDMIAGSELPPFYTAWFHSHPVHNWRLLGKNVQATTEIKWRQNDTAFNSDGSYIYSHHVYLDDRMAYIWIMQMPAKAHPNLSLREYAIMKDVYSDHIYSDGIYLDSAWSVRGWDRGIGLLQWLATLPPKIIIYSWTVQKEAC